MTISLPRSLRGTHTSSIFNKLYILRGKNITFFTNQIKQIGLLLHRPPHTRLPRKQLQPFHKSAHPSVHQIRKLISNRSLVRMVQRKICSWEAPLEVAVKALLWHLVHKVIDSLLDLFVPVLPTLRIVHPIRFNVRGSYACRHCALRLLRFEICSPFHSPSNQSCRFLAIQRFCKRIKLILAVRHDW